MTGQIDSLKTALQNKRSELAALIRAQSSQLALADDERELIDRMQGMSRRDEAVTLLDTLTHTLTAVECALRALEDGSYGICADCGGPIAQKRLQAIPWASHCIHCQEAIDHSHHTGMAVGRWVEAA